MTPTDSSSVLEAFARAAPSAAALPAGLQVLCGEVRQVFGSARVMAWLYDRGCDQLVLSAGAGEAVPPEGTRVQGRGPALPGAALREDHVAERGGEAGRTMTIPLRGRRRALGVVVLEGLPPDGEGGASRVAEAEELGRRLSASIENLLLLEDVLRSRRELAQSEKLAALGQFVAGIAHELNNPLQAVLGHLDLLRQEGRIPPAIRKELALVVREADRAARIVNNLLMFAGGRRVTPRRISLNGVVNRALALRARAWRASRIQSCRVLDESEPRVSGNRVLLQQALLNLLLNAEQELARVGGGRVEIRTARSADGQRARVEVHDSGGGIPGEILGRLFEPFFTTKDVGRGTGLGLAITYGIVKDHGGRVTAANHPEGGAVFTIDLPLSQAARGPRSR